jgi:hypothetical protein
MRNLLAFISEARTAILNDKPSSLVLHAFVASFLYLFASFALSEQHLGSQLIFILLVDSAVLSMSLTVLIYFVGGGLVRYLTGQSAPRVYTLDGGLARSLRLKSVGVIAEVVFGIASGAVVLLLWGCPYSTVNAVAPTLTAALTASLVIASLTGGLGLLSGAISLASFRWKSLLPSRN